MKNKIAILLIVTGMLGLNSCVKKTLDLQPYSSFSDQSAFSSSARVLLAVHGVYDAAQSGYYIPGAGIRGYAFGSANIQQGDMRGEDMLNQAAFYAITNEATYTSSSPNNGYMFQNIYTMVNKANLVIDGVKKASGGVISDALAKQYEGEMRFLRAMGHHELVINFARPYADGNGSKMGIIYRDFSINSDATAEQARAMKRETVAQNYAKILADLDFAEANLPAAVEPATIKVYRASKGAAIALKMRVKLHMQDWAGVITEGNKLVPQNAPFVSPIGGFALTATPEGPFANNTSVENIFSIKNDPTDAPNQNGALASMAGDPALGGRGLVRVSPIIWSDPDWKCTDLRRTQLYREAKNASGATTAVYTTKYRDYSNFGDAAPQIRYAEVLLILAEAEARNAAGVSARAVALLNAVRNRAVTNAADQYTVASFASKNALVAAILKERRIELLAEGKRWGDIHRLALDPVHAPVPGGGIPAKVGQGAATASMFNCAGGVIITKAIQAVPYSDYRFIWPIPIEETQQNSNYEQNPNY